MLIPRSRLLVYFAVIVLPLSVLGAIAPSFAMPAYAGILAFALVVLLDALPACKSLDGVQVHLPEVLRLSKNRTGSLELTIGHSGSRDRRLKLGLAFPGEIDSPHDEMDALLTRENELARLEWPCTPLKRGLYRLDICYLEGSSPLGFWGMRGTQTVTSEIRVYPDLLRERNNLAALFLNRSSLGIHAQRQIGKGREFEKLREYIPGDSFNEIHWKATAKRSRPITKVFQIERTQEVYVLLDVSRLSARPSLLEENSLASKPTETILERFITAAMVLGLAAQKQSDLFGLVTFGSRVHSFVRA
ncbi:MAG: DUF58 domain-containing protein, partial [bacterium]|nr:DUF58 domain-containing protein [bacterium]